MCVAVAPATQRRRAPMFNIGDACVFWVAFFDTCVVYDASVGRKKMQQVAFSVRPILVKKRRTRRKTRAFLRAFVRVFSCVARCVADAGRRNASLFERLPSYYVLQRKLLQRQDRISHLLGGIDIVHIEELQPLLTMEEYYSVLDAFCKKLQNRRVPIHPRSLRGLQMILEKLKIKEQELTSACKGSALLSRLYKEPSVSCEQMISCCRRLIGEPLPNLVGMHLCVSHYYSVLQDGDLCIPWNWKS
ncbi:unnamed protein product [Ranitomeya imitator]|uniref:DUF4461 domain-containing protein n=1 Tax=Ranitomeya imitator TaxID=111125 RepID=A0ABN9L7J6_9NEOB|nr:unnamed protein product [Ranitomeya imitator]